MAISPEMPALVETQVDTQILVWSGKLMHKLHWEFHLGQLSRVFELQYGVIILWAVFSDESFTAPAMPRNGGDAVLRRTYYTKATLESQLTYPPRLAGTDAVHNGCSIMGAPGKSLRDKYGQECVETLRCRGVGIDAWEAKPTDGAMPCIWMTAMWELGHLLLAGRSQQAEVELVQS